MILKRRYHFYSHFIGKKPGIQWGQIIFSRSVTKWFTWDLNVGIQVYRIRAFNPYVILPPYVKFLHTHTHKSNTYDLDSSDEFQIFCFIQILYICFLCPWILWAFDFPSSDTKKFNLPTQILFAYGINKWWRKLSQVGKITLREFLDSYCMSLPTITADNQNKLSFHFKLKITL